MQLLAIFLVTLFTSYVNAASHHQLVTEINPLTHQIFVTDEITLDFPTCKPIHLSLHANLKLTLLSHDNSIVTLTGEEVVDSFHDLKIKNYEIDLPCETKSITLQYEGEIYHPVTEPDDSYSRASADSPGLISSDGIVLAPSTYWYPTFNESDGLATFTLKTHLPENWLVVSQGDKSSDGIWSESSPQEEIYLIAYPFIYYQNILPNGLVVEAYLRKTDDDLAIRYLEMTGEYINRYSKLIGEYPYRKFSLVENFWETGFGMPSFTLLGESVIRLPFILYSSYPHEILHNWWGNGVYVESSSGNWCEGLTTYLADHLMEEMSNRGEANRRDNLQKFSDYVTSENDFPLTEFIGRNSNFSEAIGYGKAAMFFHMLRRELGDLLFMKSLSDFYQNNLFKRASYTDLLNSFEKISNKKLSPLFDQWTKRKGAPTLKLISAKATPSKNGFEFVGHISQIQEEDPFQFSLPVLFHLEGEENAISKLYKMESREIVIHETFPKRVIFFEVDPQFDLMRRISRDEVPVAISMALGPNKTLFVVDSKNEQKWREFAKSMSEVLPKESEIEVILDTTIKELPTDRTVWILGKENLFIPAFNKTVKEQNIEIKKESLSYDGIDLPLTDRSFMILGREYSKPNQLLVFVAHDKDETMPIFISKIIHYGKYSMIGFEGDRVTNKQKSVFKNSRSSMSVPVVQTDDAKPNMTKGKIEVRKPLTDLIQ